MQSHHTYYDTAQNIGGINRALSQPGIFTDSVHEKQFAEFFTISGKYYITFNDGKYTSFCL